MVPSLSDLSDLEVVVITEIICGPGGCVSSPGPAWSPRRRLELVSSVATVDALVASGWLEAWEDLESLTLTPLAADRLGIRLECGEDESEPYWVEAATPERSPRLPRWARSLGSLDHLPDPRRHEPEVEPEAERKNKPPVLAGGLGRILGLPPTRGRRPGRSLAG